MPELYYAVHNNKFYNGANVFGNRIVYQWSKNQLFTLTFDQIQELIKETDFPKTVDFYKLTTDDMFFP